MTVVWTPVMVASHVVAAVGHNVLAVDPLTVYFPPVSHVVDDAQLQSL